MRQIKTTNQQGVNKIMPAIEPLCRFIGIDPNKLSREESLLLEAELFYRICEELKEHFRQKHSEYFRTMKFTKEMENEMLEEIFLRFVINDILATKEYTIEGIAWYMNLHEDIIQETLLGKNTNPSAMLLRKTIELHRTVRAELYKNFAKRIIEKMLIAA